MLHMRQTVVCHQLSEQYQNLDHKTKLFRNLQTTPTIINKKTIMHFTFKRDRKILLMY